MGFRQGRSREDSRRLLAEPRRTPIKDRLPPSISAHIRSRPCSLAGSVPEDGDWAPTRLHWCRIVQACPCHVKYGPACVRRTVRIPVGLHNWRRTVSFRGVPGVPTLSGFQKLSPCKWLSDSFGPSYRFSIARLYRKLAGNSKSPEWFVLNTVLVFHILRPLFVCQCYDLKFSSAAGSN